MKHLMLYLCLGLLPLTAMASDTVPEAVQQGFRDLYPNVETPHWELRHDQQYVATFPSPEGLRKAFFNEQGHWLETRLRLPIEELPTGVRQFIRQYYPDAHITFTGQIYQKDGFRYRVESELPDRVVLKDLDPTGQLINESVITFSTTERGPVATPVIQPLPGKRQLPLLKH
ncbi:MAG: PepSY-like domain-containing protein [Lewinella sp.]|nr:PepSY-like domain-containing protein [Lewinella sp.]